MYKLIEYNDNYSKASRSLWQYDKDELNHNLADSESFESKVKITRNTPTGGNTIDIEIIISLTLLEWHWLSEKLILFWHGHQLMLLLILQVKDDLL